MNKVFGCILAAFLILTVCAGSAQALELPYEEGTVWNITFIKTVEGMTELYLMELKKLMVPLLEEAKKEGLILSYRIFSSPAATPGDWDLMMMTEFENFAALDGLDQKFLEIYEKVAGEDDDYEKGAAQRNEIRQILGDKLAMELILK